MDNFQFISTRNYLKRHSSSGSNTMLGPNTLQTFGYYTRDFEVNHNLGYIPLFRVYYEPFRDGKVLEGFQDTQYFLTNPPNDFSSFTEDGPSCLSWVDENKLYIRLYFTTNALAALAFNIHWVLYQDYGVEA